MGGTTSGGQKADKTTRKRYGDAWRIEIARRGGSAVTEKTKRRGFASMSKDRIQEIGAKGGSAPRQKRLKSESSNANL